MINAAAGFRSSRIYGDYIMAFKPFNHWLRSWKYRRRWPRKEIPIILRG
jgi:hypothetical protein